MDKYYILTTTPIGELLLIENDQKHISGIYIMPHDTRGLINKETALLSELKTQMDEYFKGKRKTFNIPFDQSSTPFETSVYDVLMNVPYGYTVTYGDVAYLIENEQAYRAVGSALNKNKLMILVPCHRVVSKDRLGGFSYGSEIKKILLDLEKKYND